MKRCPWWPDRAKRFDEKHLSFFKLSFRSKSAHYIGLAQTVDAITNCGLGGVLITVFLIKAARVKRLVVEVN